MGAIFAFKHKLPKGFEDATIYLFYLADGAGGGAAAAAQAEAVPVVGSLVPGMQPREAPRPFRPNVVVKRSRTAAPLAAFAAEHKAAILGRATPELTLAGERRRKLGPLAAHELEFHVALANPRLDLVQLDVVTVRDGFAYSFVCTTTKDRLASDRPQFEAFLAACG